MTDLVSFTQNVPKLKTFKTCVLNFRSICVDLSKSDKIRTYILGLLVTKYVGLIKNNLYSSHISDMLRLSLGGGVFTNYLSSQSLGLGGVRERGYNLIQFFMVWFLLRLQDLSKYENILHSFSRSLKLQVILSTDCNF